MERWKLSTWRKYLRRSVEQENLCEISIDITLIYDSESGGMVPMKRVMNVEGQPLVYIKMYHSFFLVS